MNERAERIMGRRLSPEQEATGVIPFDCPCELGYWCPVCRLADDERLEWSEYTGFLWCSVCNQDYPSVLCVQLEAEPDQDRPWRNAGPAAAIEVYLSTVEQAIAHAQR